MIWSVTQTQNYDKYNFSQGSLANDLYKLLFEQWFWLIRKWLSETDLKRLEND